MKLNKTQQSGDFLNNTNAVRGNKLGTSHERVLSNNLSEDQSPISIVSSAKGKFIRTNLNQSTGMTKTTKDNTLGSMKMSSNSSFKVKNNVDIEGPEELHSFYVGLIQQNKNLAFKFENLDRYSNTKLDEDI